MPKKKNKQEVVVGPDLFSQRDYTMLRRHRQVVRFNDYEKKAIEQYCNQCKATSKAKVLRQIIMERVLTELSGDAHPTLF